MAERNLPDMYSISVCMKIINGQAMCESIYVMNGRPQFSPTEWGKSIRRNEIIRRGNQDNNDCKNLPFSVSRYKSQI